MREIDLGTVELGTGDHGRFERVDGGVRMILPRYDGRSEKQRWPAVSFALPEDCSDYDRLEYGMFARQGDTFSISFRDLKGHGDFEHKSADREPLRLPVYVADLSVRGRFDWKHMKNFCVYRSHPGDDAEFLMKSLRLVSTVPERARSLAKAYEDIGRGEEAAKARRVLADAERGATSLREARLALARMAEDYTLARRADIRARSAAAHPGAAFAVAELDDLERVRPVGDPLTAAFRVGGAEVELARREREGLQVLVFAPDGRALTNVTIRAGEFRDGSGNLLPKAEAAPVGRVTVRSTKGPANLLGEHFDPICDFTNAVAEVGAGRIEAFHVRFRALAETPAGVYRGAVTVSADGAGAAEVPVSVAVRDVTLPVAPTIRTAVSCYGSKLLGGDKPRFEDWVLDEYRLNPKSIYTDRPPSVEDCLAKVKRGMNYVPILYIPTPQQSHFELRGQKKGFKTAREYWKTLSDEERAHYPPEQLERTLAPLRRAMPAYRAAGLLPYVAAYSFDEYEADAIPAIGELARAVKQEFPDLRIDTTAVPSDDPRTLGTISGWIVPTERYDPRVAERFRRDYGDRVWYYTIYMTIDMDSLASVRAELGARAFAQKVDGWLVWTVSRWYTNERPILAAGATGWNPESFPGLNGGGSYFCMGPNRQFLPTLRAEAIRDGIEDHCLLSMLKESKDPRAQDFLKRLDPARTTYDAAAQRRFRSFAFQILGRP